METREESGGGVGQVRREVRSGVRAKEGRSGNVDDLRHWSREKVPRGGYGDRTYVCGPGGRDLVQLETTRTE